MNPTRPNWRPRSPARSFSSTLQLARAVRAALPPVGAEEADLTVRRVFQTLRIAVNDEFSALETFLRNLPQCLKPGGTRGHSDVSFGRGPAG